MKYPECIGLYTMEVDVADSGNITLLPHGYASNGQIPLMPFRLLLTQDQARDLAQLLIEVAQESAEEARQARN